MFQALNSKSRFSFIWFSLALILLGSCGRPGAQLNPEIWSLHAPTPAQVGIIVQLAETPKSDLGNFLKSHHAQARVLHAATHLYEIQGASPSTIQKELAPFHMEKNEYIPNLLSDAPATLPVSRPSSCLYKQQDTQPTIQASIADVQIGLGSSIDLETHPVVKLTVQTTPGTTGSSVSKIEWQIQAPADSRWNDQLLYGNQTQFTPDLPGGYFITLTVQDTQKYCTHDRFELGATINKPYEGPKTARAFSEEDQSRFGYLRTLEAEQAWRISKGKGITIAIVDSGVNYNHPDLSQNILEKPIAPAQDLSQWIGLESESQSVNVGWDFVNGDAMPFDDNGHGTHVAGLAASAVSGVAPDAKILPIKAINALAGGDTATLISAILYAVDQGADIINTSFGISDKDLAQKLKPAIDYAERKGVLIVSAAGNGHPLFGFGMNNDKFPTFPASFPNENVLAVAASTYSGMLTSYSNFGPKTVALAAPGGSETDGKLQAAYYLPEIRHYTGYQGTSMAAPLVAGAAALIKSLNPRLEPVSIKKILIETTKTTPELQSKLISGGQLNAAQAAIRAQAPL